MKKMLLIAMALFLVACSSSNSNSDKTQPSESLCLYTGTPANVEFDVIRYYKIGKGSYGSVNDVLLPFVNAGKQYGADAVINYTATQRFGLLPWRFVRPVARGTAVKWKPGVKVDCVGTGGKLY